MDRRRSLAAKGAVALLPDQREPRERPGYLVGVLGLRAHNGSERPSGRGVHRHDSKTSEGGFRAALIHWAAVAPGEFGHRIAWLLKMYAI